jgi:hypothetical protein
MDLFSKILVFLFVIHNHLTKFFLFFIEIFKIYKYFYQCFSLFWSYLIDISFKKLNIKLRMHYKNSLSNSTVLTKINCIELKVNKIRIVNPSPPRLSCNWTPVRKKEIHRLKLRSVLGNLRSEKNPRWRIASCPRS